MLDLRKPLATVLAKCEEAIGEWTKDAHGRPVQTTDFAVQDADGNVVATFVGTLRLYPLVVKQADGTTTISLPSRSQVVSLLRNPPTPPTHVVTEEGANG